MAGTISMYTPFRIGSKTVKNRLVASAMFDYGADDGKFSGRMVEHYSRLAEGGAGLIITGMEGVSAGAGVGPAMVQTSSSGYEDALSGLADICHAQDCRLFVQLQHAGYRTLGKGGYDTFGVCDKKVGDMIYHAATSEELKDLAHDFALSAARCREAGCDGVQIHAAHGFLLNTFLSPLTNQRQDEYGGPIANRARLLFEIYEAVRRKVGNDFPIAVKFPFSDLAATSITPEESQWTCRELDKRGIDMIEVSSGMSRDGGPSSFCPFEKQGEREGNFLEGAERIASVVKAPVVSVCGYRTPEFVEQVLQRGTISAVSFGRPLVCEPDLPNRWKTDRRRSRCLSCNGCRKSRDIIACVQNNKSK